MTAIALLGQVTDRIEIGTAVVPIQTRHPIALAQQALLRLVVEDPARDSEAGEDDDDTDEDRDRQAVRRSVWRAS